MIHRRLSASVRVKHDVTRTTHTLCVHDRGKHIQLEAITFDVSPAQTQCTPKPNAPKKDWCAKWELNVGPLVVWWTAIPLHQRLVMLSSCEFNQNKMFCVSRQNYLAYVRKATLDLDELGQGKLVGCRTNFNRSKIFLSPSFVEVLQLGIVAKEQRFPKLCPTMANSRDRARYRACNEAC